MLVTVKAIPKASRDEVAGPQPDGSYRVKVTAAPDKGKANAAICEALAEHFRVPLRSVRLVRGETSRNKVFEVDV